MGRLTATCSMCGRTTTEIFVCGICGAQVCSRCYVHDVGACKQCLRRGLWVGDTRVEGKS
ncbi:MAG: orotate phosphoribosyltransferase [Candidatus Hadarchaeota archaeon]|nr:orotate phosphoribosyltransferase [Candidatus Hadarchaeota archaeon]